MFNWLRKRLLGDQADRITYLYQLVVALARIQMIHPDVLSKEAQATDLNSDYASKVLLKGKKV